jgi:hypothetical protein
MQFAQSRDVFVCDYIATIQVCQAEITSFYIDDATAFSQDMFWDFKALCQTQHDAIPLAWVSNDLDLNFEGLEYLHFAPTGHSIRVIARKTCQFCCILSSTHEIFWSTLKLEKKILIFFLNMVNV